MNSYFETVLDRCLERVQSGEDLEACLRDYPDFAERIRPMLETRMLFSDLAPAPSEEAKQRSEARMIAALERANTQTKVQTRPTERQPVSFWNLSRYTKRIVPVRTGKEAWNMKLATRLFAVVLLVGLLSAQFVLSASANALPGDDLYFVKRAMEQATLYLATSETKQAELQNRYQEQRRLEILAMLQEGREGEVEFEGVVEEVSNGKMVVSGLELDMTDETIVDEEPLPGERVQAHAYVHAQGDIELVAAQVQTLSRIGPNGPNGEVDSGMEPKIERRGPNSPDPKGPNRSDEIEEEIAPEETLEEAQEAEPIDEGEVEEGEPTTDGQQSQNQGPNLLIDPETGLPVEPGEDTPYQYYQYHEPYYYQNGDLDRYNYNYYYNYYHNYYQQGQQQPQKNKK